jgi:pimeloyl-ACP methyl ester carboxylesterase
MDLYFISGLGADSRVFQKLILPDFFTIHHIVWVPVSKDDSMEAYCRTLSDQIDKTRPFILVGLSFGGIVAIQMSKFLSPVQTVIISSFCFRSEIPKFYVFLAKTKIYRLLPSRFLLRPNKFIFRLFGANEPMKKKMLVNILEDTDPVFFRWAVKQLFTVNNEWKPESFLHIHGTADKILPLHPSMNAIEVQDGEHLMVYSKAEEVSEILDQYLRRS